MLWFFDAVAHGFRYPTDPARIQLFRIIYGTVLTIRFALAFGQGGWDRLALGSLTTFVTEKRYGPTRTRLLVAVYRPMLIVRTLAACALAAGLVPRLALLPVLAGIAMELLYLKSPNAVRFALLTGICLLLAGDLGTGLHLMHGSSTANTWAQCLLVLLATDIYWNSAWQKLRSPQFRSGLYLAQWIHTYSQVREHLRHRRQFAVPGLVRRHAGNLTDRDIRLWRGVAATVIAAEIALPPALLIPAATPYAIGAGIAMHAAFTCLKPVQLITFSGITLATYVTFFA
ncbi:hypothetical protein [Streptomyces sp. NPDC004286]|uniref:hypothetical protein n=1 Tax=Streptomyces sp. NPDC004286 TaxID=3364696 RepID=UPI003688733C